MTRLNLAYSKIFSTANELMFATACCVSLDLETGQILHANAGHPLPMVIESDGTVDTAQVAEEALGPALGLFGDAQYVHVAADLVPGKRMVFYTDGLTEARNAEQEEFNETGLSSALAAHLAEPMPVLLDSLVRDAVQFAGSTVFEDDVCVLGVNYVRQ